jgi:multiple sugar transport system permease protein
MTMASTEASTPRSKRRFKELLPIYLGLAPFLILLTVFTLAPMAYGLAMSFTDWSLTSRAGIHFVGLENYQYIMSGDSLTGQRFFTSLINLAIYVPITVAIGLTVALFMALVATNLPPGMFGWVRTSYIVPTVMPLFLCVGVWSWLMNSDGGLVANALASIGIGSDVNWVTSAGWAIAIVVLIDVWHSVGFNFIIFSTGIQEISPELYDAADVDGASVFQKMRAVTIPLLEPILFFVVIYSFVSALQVYDIPQILTAGTDPNAVGGPNQVMLFPVMEIVRNVRVGSQSGLARAAAEGTILMVVIAIVTFVLFALRRKRT